MATRIVHRAPATAQPKRANQRRVSPETRRASKAAEKHRRERVRNVRSKKPIFTVEHARTVAAEIEAATQGAHIGAAISALAVPGAELVQKVEASDRAYADSLMRAVTEATAAAKRLESLSVMLNAGAVRMFHSLMARPDWFEVLKANDLQIGDGPSEAAIAHSEKHAPPNAAINSATGVDYTIRFKSWPSFSHVGGLLTLHQQIPPARLDPVHAGAVLECSEDAKGSALMALHGTSLSLTHSVEILGKLLAAQDEGTGYLDHRDVVELGFLLHGFGALAGNINSVAEEISDAPAVGA
jgi:hypothetical protein